jgi:putative ABC transport system permease protein
MPAGFEYPDGTELWTPLGLPASSTDPSNLYPVVGRLKDGISLEEAQREMRVVHEQFNRDHPDMPSSRTADCILLQESIVGPVRAVLWILFGAVGFILLIACANVAHLLLAHCNGRRQEFAVRGALGASRSRLVGQMLVESVVLSFLGGGLGLALAFWSVDLVRMFGPADIPRLHTVSVSAGVLAFTLLLSLLTGILFGVGPALQASRGSLEDTLKEGGRGSWGEGGRGAFRRVLVTGELAVCLVLVVGAALLVKSLLRLEGIRPGFDPRNVLTFQMSLPAKYGTPESQDAFYRQILERFRTIPGVDAAAAINSLPTELGPDLPVSVEGRSHADPNEADGECQYRAISADYFRLMRIPLRRGRPFSERDSLHSPSVAIVNETAARAMWPDEDPIGKQVRIGKTMGPEWSDPGPREVVGIVADIHDLGLAQPAPLEIFVPYAQVPPTIVAMEVKQLPPAFVVRTKGRPRAARAAVQDAILAVDRNQAIAGVRTLEEILSASVAAQHFNTWLLSLFAFLALALALVGTYGVVSYTVNQRTPEIGLRIALGAQRGDVMRLVLGGGMRLVCLGVGIGWLAALGLTRVLSHALFGVTATDPATFVTVGLALGGVAFIACAVPALRAVRVAPMDALRRE